MLAPTRRAAAAGAAAAAAHPGAGAGAGPRRIVSLNPCLDAILVRVAERDRIVALSRYNRDPFSSSLGEAGRTYPLTSGGAEEVMALAPDLVLADRFSSRPTLAAFARLHIRTELFDLPQTVEDSLAQVARIAALTHRPERGAALIARIRAALAAAAPAPGERRLSALVFQAGGFAAAGGTMMDEMLRRCGFDNAAARYGLHRSGDVPLERLLADPPEVLLASQGRPGAPTWADRVISHPALAHVAGRMYRASLPQALTFCGGPVLIGLAAALAAARRDALAARA